ncbi:MULTISPECIES: MarR family winged helix-turn-helix transcriptional regulator [Pseudoalteromonas]|uniref:MarR family transcriptional regulator n=1 Tax=Pseudoalteromonas obscura TaxID=3048491 RepID=A0ABT7EME8_9GAMM|nr:MULTISPECIES: MarR family transcriptional regulator [Pseudoalteromonas]MBQ4837823.1 MarR family transcriptional regulator [Pseudoalteromonas luteoviolacea]MDK2596232.1 MarR family transcriptional regulator [Pseudoalteromonas sp. P94(2023)]
MSSYFDNLDNAFLAHFCRRLSDLIIEQGAKVTESYGITTPSTAISSIYFIEQNHGVTVAELASALEVTHQMATQRINTLESLDLIYRKPNPQDKRAKMIHLTELGKQEAVKLKPLTKNMSQVFSELNQQIECDIVAKVRLAEQALIDKPLMQRLNELHNR